MNWILGWNKLETHLGVLIDIVNSGPKTNDSFRSKLEILKLTVSIVYVLTINLHDLHRGIKKKSFSEVEKYKKKPENKSNHVRINPARLHYVD